MELGAQVRPDNLSRWDGCPLSARRYLRILAGSSGHIRTHRSTGGTVMAQYAPTVNARRRRLAVTLVAVALLAAGAEFAIEGPPWAGGRRVLWSGTSVPGHIGASFRYFDGNDSRPVSGKAGGSLTIRYDLEPSKGVLALNLLSPEGNAIWTRSAGEPVQGSTTIPLPASGRYRVAIAGEKSRGSFDVNYRLDTPTGH